MSLNDYGGSSGGTYFSAKSLREGMKGRITAQPYADQNSGLTDKEGRQKVILRFPMEIEGLGEGLWSPGKFAIGLISETIGPQWEQWRYPVEGHFEERKVESKDWRGLAWHFVIDAPKGGATASKSQPTSTTSKISRDKQIAALKKDFMDGRIKSEEYMKRFEELTAK